MAEEGEEVDGSSDTTEVAGKSEPNRESGTSNG